MAKEGQAQNRSRQVLVKTASEVGIHGEMNVLNWVLAY